MKKIIIIAEAGVNHNGDYKKALKMVDVASECKADYIKFQTFFPKELVQRDLGLAKYQKNNSSTSSQYDMLRKLSLKQSDFIKIKQRCKKKKIKFLTSPFDLKSISFLKKLKLNTIKIPSGEINNIPYLREVGRLNKNLILSTGISTLSEIKIALRELIKSGTRKNKISILHCNTQYPANINKLNLKSILFLKKKLKMKIGYSDHSLGHEASLIALAFGAKIFEKHFTLDKNLKGPDHKASLSPEELRVYIEKLHLFNKALGFYKKEPSREEIIISKFVRKQIVASKNIIKGEKFTSNNITTKRAKIGIAASNWDKVLGKVSKYNFLEDENIKI